MSIHRGLRVAPWRLAICCRHSQLVRQAHWRFDSQREQLADSAFARVPLAEQVFSEPPPKERTVDRPYSARVPALQSEPQSRRGKCVGATAWMLIIAASQSR